MDSSTSRWFFVAVLLLLSTVASAQSTESHDTEHVTIEDVGEYKPESEPELSQVARTIIDATNKFRKKQNLKNLDSNKLLDQTAQDFADYMARTNRYGHTADGKKPSQRAAAHDYDYCIVAENIAYFFQTSGFTTEELSSAAFEGWKTSPGHRKNMLQPHVLETGVAVSQSETTGVYYAVQLFGRPRSESLSFEVVNLTEQEIIYMIAEREFTSAPQTKRRHEICVPSKISFAQGEQSLAKFDVAAQRQYLISLREGELKVSSEAAASDAERPVLE